MTLLDRDWIAARIPHDGCMCLIERVSAVDENRLACHTRTHLDPAHPLRREGRLAAVHSVEYAAQAMAIHGAWLAENECGRTARPRAGFLASVRDANWRVTTLDESGQALDIEIERLSGDANNVLYAFRLLSAGALLASGRAAVVLDAGAHLSAAP